MTQHTNRLATETSPYLQQHAHNPVDWYPWGEKAFNRARTENKPIFLSIGYSACHWCHVMERESFENDSTAVIMNQYFVNIKVDREERPDLDDIYMSFVQMSTGSGGWPMSVFLTPEGKPFFGGTYFPPEESYGRPGFPQLLEAVAEAWDNDREGILHGADTAVERLQSMLEVTTESTPLSPDVIDTAVQQMLQRFDPIDGGFSGAPKFPPSYSLSLMMRHYYRGHDARVLKTVTHTLDKMAQGGMYDQLGGGFHRYSVDAQWLVPHFEKMLYDNALLAATYCDAYQLTQKPFYKRVALDILDYVLRDMIDSTGAFHSAEDADSEGEEGKFYVWTAAEIIAALGEGDAKLFCDYYDVSTDGNFEHQKSILHVRVALEEFANRYSLNPDELTMRLAACKSKLMKIRSSRVRPHKDDKVLTDWNGLMLTALSRGYQISGEAKYLKAAQKCAAFLESKMFSNEGLKRVYRAGVVKQHGFITDYTFLLNGLVDLYESDFDIHWLEWADQLAQEMLDKFTDKQHGGFFMTIADQKDLLVRQKDSYDGTIPSGNSTAAMALLRLADLLDKRAYRSAAENAIAALAANANKVPLAYMNLFNASDFTHHNPREIAIVGRPRDPKTQNLLKQIYSTYLPNRILTMLDPSVPNASAVAQLIPILRDRPMVDDVPTVYICENYACKLPVTNADALALQLNQ